MAVIRTRRLRLAPLLAPVALAATLLGAPSFEAQEEQSFLEAYKGGVEAVEAEDWPRAERLMRSAVAGRAEEADRLLRHLHLRPYVPHFYLGLALAEQGKCEEALSAFAESERQGVIGTLAGEVAVLRDHQARCREALAAAAAGREERRAVADLVAQAEAAAEAVAALASDPALAPGWERGEPSLAARLAEARETIDQARRRMAGADLAAATDLARGALGQLAAIRRETELRRSAAAEARETTAARIETVAASGRRLLADTRELAQGAPELARRRSAVAETLDRAGDLDPDLPLPDLQELAALLERRTAALRAAAAPPPQELLAAADAWLRGEPETVLELLAGADTADGPYRDPRARAHALLLRAAAAFTLHEAGPDAGGSEGTLLAAARQDAATSRQLDPALTPLPSAFSPRFRTLWSTLEPPPPAP